MFGGLRIEGKMALGTAVLRRRLSRAKYDTDSSLYGLINNIFGKNSKKIPTLQ